MQIVNLYLAARQKLLILIRLSDYSTGRANGDVLCPKDNPVGMVIQEHARRNGTVRRRRKGRPEQRYYYKVGYTRCGEVRRLLTMLR